jgi:hypothetical protein
MKEAFLWFTSKVFDQTTTNLVINKYSSGYEVEANPFMRSVFKNFGNFGAFFTFLLSSLLIYFVVRRYKSCKPIVFLVYTLILFNFFISGHNMLVYFSF